MGHDRVELFAEFVALRSAALQRTAYLITGDPGLAQDLVLEALTRTRLAWSRLREPHRAEGFARAAVATEAIRRSRHDAPPGRTDAPPDPDEPDEPEDPDGRLLHRLARLPVRQRVVIVLRHHDELTEREIADALGCGVRTVERELAAGLTDLGRHPDGAPLPREAQR